MKHAIIAVAMTMAFGAGAAFAAGNAMSREDHQARKERIEADYKAARQQCDGMKGNAKDVCMAQAKGKNEVVKAQLEAQRDPGPKRDSHVQKKQAEADYNVARQKCDDLRHVARDACRNDAKATYEHAKDQAKVAPAAEGKGVRSDQSQRDGRQARNASTDTEYAAARERCGTLSPQARDNCMNEVRKRFSKM